MDKSFTPQHPFALANTVFALRYKFRFLLVAILLTCISLKGWSQFSTYQDFTLGTAGNASTVAPISWKSNGSGTETFKIANTTPISYSGYAGGGCNYLAVALGNTTAINVATPSFGVSSGTNTFFYSFLLNVSTLPTASTYFAALAPAYNSASSTYSAVLWTKNVTGGYALGISKTVAQGAVYKSTPTVLTANTTYLVTVEYVYVSGSTNDNVYLWINPTISSQPATASAEISYTTASVTDPAAISSSGVFTLVSAATSSGPAYSLDGLRVASNTTAATAWSNLAAVPLTFPASGTAFASGTYVIPTGVTSFTAQCWGGGGGGGGAQADWSYGFDDAAAGGGGGGAYSTTAVSSVTAGGLITISVGAGGTAGSSSGGNGGAGGSSSVTYCSVVASAAGGSGGTGDYDGLENDIGAGGAGGSTSGSTGSVIAGGTGGSGFIGSSNDDGGGGGGGAGSTGAGQNGVTGSGSGSTASAGGAGGTPNVSPAGKGGAGGKDASSSSAAAGSTGNAVGGGGGGASAYDADDISSESASGGTGAAGQVIITYTTCTTPTGGSVSGTSTVCSGATGATYSVSGVSGTVTTYTWSVPSGATITAGAGTTNITVTWGSTGGNVSCAPTNNTCVETALTFPVTVNSTPATPGTISGTAVQCTAGATGQVYSIAAVSGATTYTWSVPSGWTITGGAGTTSVTVTAGAVGNNGNISVTAGNTCGTSAAQTLAVSVGATPATPGAITGTTATCASTAGYTYSVSAVANATTYTWTVPATWTITAGAGTNSITVTSGTSGGNVSVTAGSGCGTSAAQTLAVTTTAVPATPGSITGTANYCSAGATGQLYSISAVSGATTYTWSVPSGWSITGGQNTTSVTVTVGAVGNNGNVSVTAGNSCGTSAAQSLAVTVSATPATPGSISGNSGLCASTAGNVYSVTAVANATTYTWTVPSGWTITAGTGTNSITVTSGTTTGNISVTAGNSCGTSAASVLAVSASTTPTNDAASSSSTCWVTNGTNTYDVIIKASSNVGIGGYTGATAYGMMALINYTGPNATANGSSNGGYMGWNTTTALLTQMGFTKNQMACTGGGYVGMYPSGYGYDKCDIVSATTSVSGNQRTVTFTVKPTATYPDFIANDISVYSENSCGTVCSGWSDFGTNFSSIPTSTPTATASPTAVCSGGAVSLSSTAPANATSQVLLSGTGAGGFEAGTTFALNYWTAVNGSGDVWQIGSAGGVQSGSRAAFVGPNATTYTATGNATVDHIYTDVYIPTGATNVFLNYNLKYPTTDGTYDYIYLFTTTTANTPVGGTVPSTGYTTQMSNTNTAYSSFTAMPQVNLSSLAGSVVRIVFTFKNDGSSPYADPAIDNVSLTYTPAAPTYTYAWTSTPAGYTAATQTATANPTVATTYNVVANVANGCPSSTASTAQVTINPSTPATPGAITGTTTQCPALTGQVYSITAVTNATTYTWNVPSGWTVTAGAGTNSITVTTGSTGQNGNISVTAGNSCGTSAAQTLAVTVGNAAPATPGTITGTALQCNAGATGQVYSIGAVTNATTYTWSVPTGWSITGGQGTTSATVTVGTVGQNGNVSVTAGNACGTSAAQTLAVTVSAVPAQPSTITGPTAPCTGGTTQAYSVTNISGVNYAWTFPSGGSPLWSQASGTTTNAITANIGSASGNVTVTPSNGCGNGTARTLAVTPGTGPTVGVSAPSTTLCTGGSVTLTATGGSAYSWTSNPSGFTSTSNPVTVTPTFATTYTVTETGSGCNNFATITIRTNTGGLDGYTATQGSATYTTIVGAGGTAVTGWRNSTNSDENLSNAISLPSDFNFPYDGGYPKSFLVSTNGFITFNTATKADGEDLDYSVFCSPPTEPYCGDNTLFTGSPGLAGTLDAIAPFYNDLYVTGSLNSSMYYLVSGSSPNRILTVEWKGLSNNYSLGSNCDYSDIYDGNLNFQVKCYEGSGNIEFLYSTMTQTSYDGCSGTSIINTYTAGINSSTLTTSPTLTQLFTQQTANSATFSATAQNNLTTLPNANTHVLLSRIAPPVATALPACTAQYIFPTNASTAQCLNATLSWAAGDQIPTGYKVYIDVTNPPTTLRQTSGSTYCDPSTTSLGALAANTTYYWKVVPYNSYGDAANVVVWSFTTGAGNVITSLSYSPAQTVCAGTPVTITANGTICSGSTYQWEYPVIFDLGCHGDNFGEQCSGNAYTYTSSSNSSSGDLIDYVFIRGCNTVTSCMRAVTHIKAKATTSTTTFGSSPICAGSSTTASTTVSGGIGPFTYQWKLNGVNVVNGTPAGAVYTNATSATMTIAGITAAGSYSYSCQVTDNGAGSCGNVTSTAASLTVTAGSPVSVSVSPSPSGAICSGTSVTFTATPTNGGTTPIYQWQLNGSNVGTNSTTYSNNSLANNDQVTCILTSNATCPSGNPATSNTVTTTVNPNLPVSISVSPSPSGAICSGTNVTFTASPTNGGGAPSYQWQLNGSNVGTNSATYSNSGLANNDQVACVITSNATCATGNPATSNTVTTTVNPNLPVSVSVSPSPSGAICSGTNITFTASPTNGGGAPSYQWKLNGSNVGTNSTTYNNSSLANNDQVTCVLTSNATCATGNPATSNTVTTTVNPNLPVSVSVSPSPSGAICSGTNVTFTATPINGGGAPSYQWQLNGSNVGTNSATYSNSNLANNDQVTCVLTSNATCATGNPATSNTVTTTVNPNLPVSVSVSPSPSGAICSGTNVTFTASPTNGGGAPAYQWQLNGSNVGTNSATYSNSNLANNDQVTCVLTSNATCATGNPATSNTITTTVNASLPVSITITASPSNIVCAATHMTFTAIPTNGGTTPSYQWKLNGNNVGTNSTTYTNNAPANNDQITCVLTSNATCATSNPATSNTVTMTVSPPLTASISGGTSPICYNTSPGTLTATAGGGSGTYTYQWYNGSGAVGGATASTYAPGNLTSSNNFYCQVNSTTCGPTNTSIYSVSVRSNFTVTATGGSSPICYNTPPGTFTANANGGGGANTYQWYNNSGAIAGATASTYAPGNLTASDAYHCSVTNASCGGLSTNTISITVDAIFAASINSGTSPLCYNSSPGTFTATASGGTGSYTYQWYNTSGSIGGATASTYAPGNLTAGNSYNCSVTSGSCGTITTNTSAITVAGNLSATVPTVSVNPVCITTTGGGTNVEISASVSGATYQLQTSGGSNVGSSVTGNGGNIDLPTGNLSASVTYQVMVTAAGGACTYTTPANITVTAVNPDIAFGAQLNSNHFTFGTIASPALPASWTAPNNSNSNHWVTATANPASSNSYSYYNSTGTSSNASTGAYIQTPVGASATTTVDLVSSAINTTGFSNVSVQWAAQKTAGYTGSVNLYYSIDGGSTWSSAITFADVPANLTGTPWSLVNNTVQIKLPAVTANQANLKIKWSANASTGADYYSMNDIGVYGLGKIVNCGTGNILLPYLNTTCSVNEYTLTADATNPWPSSPAFSYVSGVALSGSPLTIAVPASTASGTYNLDITVDDGAGHASSTVSFPVTEDKLISATAALDNCSCNYTTSGGIGGAFGNIVTVYAGGGVGSGFYFTSAGVVDTLLSVIDASGASYTGVSNHSGTKGIFWSKADGGSHSYTISDGYCSTTGTVITQNTTPAAIPFGSATGQPTAITSGNGGGNGISGSFNNSGTGDPNIANVNGKALTCHQTAAFGNNWVTYQVNNLDNTGQPIAGDSTNNKAVVEINNNGVELDSVEVSVYRNANLPVVPNAATTNTACYGYPQYGMERHFMIKSTKSTGPNAFNSEVGVRLYFTDAEFQDLAYWTMHAATQATGQSASCAYNDTVTNINSIYVTKYTGNNEDGDYTNNSPSGLYRVFGKNAVNSGNGPLSAIDGNGTTVATGGNTNLHYVQMNVREFSEFWLGGSQDIQALPVSMLYLQAEGVDNSYIAVTWATALEINNNYFRVERSADGQTWDSIGMVQGHGNTTSESDYRFDDHGVVPNVNYYYRLKQVDNNGRYTYTEIVTAKILGQTWFNVSGFIPNPTLGNTMLHISTSANADISISLTDVLGQQVYNNPSYHLVAGENQVSFDFKTISAGTYTAVITNGNAVYTKRLVIVK